METILLSGMWCNVAWYIFIDVVQELVLSYNTSVNLYQATRCHLPEHSILYSRRLRKLRSDCIETLGDRDSSLIIEWYGVKGIVSCIFSYLYAFLFTKWSRELSYVAFRKRTYEFELHYIVNTRRIKAGFKIVRHPDNQNVQAFISSNKSRLCYF